MNDHREALGMEIRAARRAGRQQQADAMLQELRSLCPPDSVVRIHQRFTLPLSVRELLDQHTDDVAMRIHTSVAELQGLGHGDYETRRQRILAEAEAA